MNDNRKDYSYRDANYEKLPPVYIQKWAWEKAHKHQPQKYHKFQPNYKGERVILT